MFGDHFYHAILRKTVAVFGTLFNNISVVRRSSNGNIADVQKVPLAYGPKQKFLSRLEDQNDLTGTKVALKLPRMSFEITGMTYDSTTKLSAFNKLTASESSTSRTSVNTMVPYLIDFELNILAKNQDDALQILEQILPFFQPAYNVSVKYVDGIDNSFDMPITLNSVGITDDYEGDYTTRRVILYTLTFSAKVRFFSGLKTGSIIRQIDANLYQTDPEKFLEGLRTEVTPDNATPSSTYTPTLSYTTIPSDAVIVVRSTVGAKSEFTVGGDAYGQTSGSQAVVKAYEYDSVNQINIITLEVADGYFLVTETLVDDNTNNTIVIDTYTVS